MNFTRTFEPVEDHDLAESIIKNASTFWFYLAAVKMSIGILLLFNNVIDKRDVSKISIIALTLGTVFLLSGYLLRKFKSITVV